MYLAYSLLTLLLFVVVSPYFVYQAIRYKKYIGSLGQRLGYLPISFNVDGEESIWIHAVSVGEALTARALAEDLKARYPRLRLFLSTTTMAGQEVARRSLHHVDAVFYFPFDWAFIVRRTLNIVKPRVFIMMETEIWPNLLRVCRKRGVKMVVINGRISSRSYPRYRLIRPFFRRVLADVDRFCMQSEESARRLVDLGADPARVTVTGSLKFDSLEVPTAAAHGRPRERVLRFFRISPNRPVIIAGSTIRGEEAAVLRAFARMKTTMPNALAIVAPRQAERFGEVERLSREAGFVTARRSELAIDAEPRADVVVLDSLGELAQLYQVATAVFVGGSLVNQGGHNILEPAMFGKPIVFGPYMQNFQEIADAFITNGAAMQVQSDRELDEALLTLVTDPGAARAAWSGGAGACRGQSRREEQDARGHRRSPAAGQCATRRRCPSLPIGALIHVLGSMYSAVAVWRRRWYAREPSRRARLSRPVISVGNLSVGGSGKTPVVGYIARLLLEAGERPAILTRGYGRRRGAEGHHRLGRHGDPRRHRFVGRRAADAGPCAAGRRGVVGDSRYDAGRLAESELGATVHVLDDGFQHLQVARDVDLLLLSEEDLSDRPLPGGRLSEPLTAAAVADAALVVGRLCERGGSCGEDGRDWNGVPGDPHAGGAAYHCESVRLRRGAVAVPRVCDGRDCPARALFFRCRGRGVGPRGLDGLSRPPSLLASRHQAHRGRGAGGRGAPSC